MPVEDGGDTGCWAVGCAARAGVSAGGGVGDGLAVGGSATGGCPMGSSKPDSPFGVLPQGPTVFHFDSSFAGISSQMIGPSALSSRPEAKPGRSP